VTKEQYAKMQSAYGATAAYDGVFTPFDTPQGVVYKYSGTDILTMYEHGFAYSGGQYISGAPAQPLRGTNIGANLYGGISFDLPGDATGLMFHTHVNTPKGSFFDPVGPEKGGYPKPQDISRYDMDFAADHPNMTYIMGWNGGLMQYNGSGLVQNIGKSGWWDIDCSQWLKSDKDK
jgi:hypothetical protein